MTTPAAAALRTAIINRGEDIHALAERLAVHPQRLALFASGDASLPDPVLQKLATLFWGGVVQIENGCLCPATCVNFKH